MKNIILCTLAMCNFFIINAQTPTDPFPLIQNYGEDPDFRIIIEDMEEWILENPGDPISKLNPYYKAKYFMMPRIDQSGSMKGYTKTLSDYISQYIPECDESFITSDWSSIGPDRDAPNTQYLGLVQSVWVNPADENHILVGSSGGGIWESKSTYTDPEWHFITGNPGFPGMGIRKIAVNPSNTNEIYAATHMYAVLLFERSYGVGAIYSNDGGATWNVDDELLEFIEDPSTTIYEDMPLTLPYTYNLKYLPTTTAGVYDLYLPFFNYILKKNFATGEWIPVSALTLGVDASYQDIQSVPGDPNFLFASVSGILDAAGNKSNVKYSTNGGVSWSLLTEHVADRVLISVPTDEEMFVMYNYDDWFGAGPVNVLLVYDITGGTPVLVNNITTNIKVEGEMSVSPTNTDIIYVSDTQDALYKSTNGGTIFTKISFNNSNNDETKLSPSTTHTDVRDLLFYKPTTDISGDNPGDVLTGDHDIIFIANDGGLSKTTQGGGTDLVTGWTNMNRTGLNINNSLGFGSSEIDKNRIITTANDGDGFIRRESGWDIGPFWDQGESAVSNTDPNRSLGGITNGAHSFYSITVDPIGFSIGSGVPSVPRYNAASPNPEKKVVEYHEITDDVWTGTSDLYSIENTFPYVGGSYSWVQKSLTWYEIPPTDFSLSINQPITGLEFVPNPNNDGNNFIYYGVHWSPNYPADIGTISDHKMIRFDPTLAPSEQWKNITPYSDADVYPFTDGNYWSAFNEGYVFDIAADPTNPKEIWAGFTKGWYDDSPIDWRVMYSPDGGDTWYDRSSGLPDFPVNTLTYWKGTDDIIFAGTDVGVYVWNKTEGTTTGEGVWECYMNGLPKVFVTDMEINYCTQSLRVSTYGHSMWETPLPSVGIAAYQSIEITEDQTWSQDFDTYTNVVVNSGVVLTIENCEVRFPKNGSLIVNQGGMVIIDGAILTNHCDFWAGIEVRGNPTAPHPDIEDIYTGIYPVDEDDQGVVLIKNGGTIENAEVGISTIGGYFFKGGIIIGQDAVFKNNQTSLIFNGYDFGSADIDDDNISQFYDCDFVVNSDYMQEDFPYHVVMYEVDGVDFLGCRFSDDRSTNPSNSSEGIFSVNATYRVKNVPCPPTGGCPEYLPIESNFTGFFRGIEVANTRYLPRDVEINGVLLETNRRGILLSAVENSLVINNIFEIPDHSTIPGYGLYLEGCKDYQVENNYFTNNGGLGITGAPFRTGVYVMNNSDEHTEIYRNIFEGLEIAIRCQGDNSHLHIKCNDFESIIAAYNIYVSSGKLGSQGRCLPAPASWEDRSRAPAGNTFSHDCLNIEADFRIAVTTPAIPPLQYRYHTGSTDYRPDVDCYTSSLITLQECILIGYDQNEYPSCPSRLPEEGGGSSGFMMMSFANETEIGIGEEMAKIDGGSTEELIAEVYNATSETELYDSLKAVGSYLSEEVLTTLVETPYVLNTYLLLDVLNENSPITQAVGSSLEISTYEVPTIIVEELTDTISLDEDGNQISVESPLQMLLEDIDALESIKYSALDEAIKLYLNENKVDSALFAAETYKTNYTSKKKNEIYFTNADYLTAQNSLEFIDVVTEEDQDYKSLYSTLIDIYSDERSIQEMDSVEETEIRNIGGKYTPAGVKALNMLKYAYNETHEEIFDEEDEYFYRLSVENQYPTNSKFKLYPNPADEIVYIELLNSDLNSVNLLHVYDLTGKRLQTVELKKDSNVSWINVKDLNPGIYFFEVVSDDNSENGSLNSTLKLVIE